MKWFRHMTNSHDDEKLLAIRDKMGLEGYGMWWFLLELVAGQMNENSPPVLRISLKCLAKVMGKNCRSLPKQLQLFRDCSLIQLEFISETDVEIKIPNISKFKDEWTRKKEKNSGVAPESLRSYTEQNKAEQSITDTYIPPIVPPTGGNGTRKKSRSSKSDEVNQAIERELFGSDDDPIGLDDEPAVGIWQLWIPSRRGTKAEVRKAYKQVRKPDNVAAIREGVEAFMRSPYVTSRIETGNGGYIKLLATWLRARGWEEDRAAWNEPCQEWRKVHVLQPQPFRYVGPCQAANLAPRDGTLTGDPAIG